jgi:intracellular sulfur oxidation DsrE/DsrF family protein
VDKKKPMARCLASRHFPFVTYSFKQLRMKALVCSILAMLPLQLLAQSKPVRIIFDVTSSDTVVHQTAVRHVAGMAKAYPDAQLEVVIYGGALPMIQTSRSSEAQKIQELAGQKNVVFKVCEVTMKRYNVTFKELLPGVMTVPDAILEIVQKQGEGWGYIKEVKN